MSAKGDPRSHLFEVKERFILLRRLGIESVYLAREGRRVDSSLLLEMGALTTNRLLALVQALPAVRLTRRSFFNRMHSGLEPYRRAVSTQPGRGVGALAVAQVRLDRLECLVPRLAAEAVHVQSCAVECAIGISLFLEAWLGPAGQDQDVQPR